MSVSEESKTYASFLDLMLAEFDRVETIRTVVSDSTGTHVLVKYKNGKVTPYLLNNLPAPTTSPVTSNQGTPNTIANAWPAKITDGTNVAKVATSSQTAQPGLDVYIDQAGNLVSIGGQPISVSQNLLGLSDRPDVSFNQANPLKVKPLATLVEAESFAPTSIAAGTAETAEVSGATALNVGQEVDYTLSGGPVTTLTTAADIFTYVALKGNTSGKYYAVAFLEQIAVGRFPFVTASEKLNIVVRNQDTAAHVFSGYWQASSP